MNTTELIKHELVNEDSVFAGTALEVVRQLRDQGYFERGIDLDIYIRNLIDLILQIAGVEITLEGKTVEERAESFIQGLIASGYFKEA